MMQQSADLALGIVVIHEEKLEEDADGDDEASEAHSPKQIEQNSKPQRWGQVRRQDSNLEGNNRPVLHIQLD